MPLPNLPQNKSIAKPLTTQLSDTEESDFQKWYNGAAFSHNWAKNPDDREHFYDFRGFYKNSDLLTKMNASLALNHLPDTYKKPGHPTFSDESIYKDLTAGHWNGEEYIPSKFSRDKLDNWINTYYKWNPEDLDYLYSEAGKSNFSPESVLYMISTESGFNPYSKSKVSSAVGLGQLTEDTLKDIFGSNWKQVQNEYLNGTRSVKDSIDDVMKYVNNVDNKISKERDQLTYGRLKINMLAPNSKLDDKISKAVYNNSLTADMKTKVRLGQSTYRDLMRLYDNEFDKWRSNF